MRHFPRFSCSTNTQSPGGSPFLKHISARLFALLVALFLLHPTAAYADPITRTVTLAWDASPSEGVIGYRVHYGTHSNDYTHVLDVANSTSADIPNLVEGTTYYFVITSYDSAGTESWPSDELVHTVNPGVILNISARANVQNDDDVLIAGFIIGGSSKKTIVLRALGPSLAAKGVPHPLANPFLLVFGPGGDLIGANDDWPYTTPNELTALGLEPKMTAESGLVMTLPPGAYTAVIRGGGGSTGIALLEVYDVGVPPQ